ncbi:late embryogenesis abundant protein [Trifolium repens]|nr:late embryogenesis abundant protein [Trifolium repens]
MAETDQANPLAPVRVHPRSDDEEKALNTKNRRRKFKLCGCVTAILLLLLVIVIVILVFTVFKVKDPKVTTNEVQLTNFDVNAEHPLDLEIAQQRYTIGVYRLRMHNVIKARKTSGLNVTVDVMADRLVSSPNLLGDVANGEMIMSTYSVIPGRVKMLFIKKHVEVKMNCTMTINISKRGIEDLNCKHKVKL